MNARLTANTANATRVTPPDPRHDLTEGEFFTRKMPRVGEMDADSNTFRAVIATSTPVMRRDAKGPFREVLNPAGVEDEPGQDWPLQTDHSRSARETVGRVSDLVIDGQSVSASLRLSFAEDVIPLVERVRDGILRHVSAGYQVLEWAESVDPETRIRTKTATKWRLLEVSLVPIPADRNAIIQRSIAMPLDSETRADLVEQIRSACDLSQDWADQMLEAETELTDAEVRASAREAMLARQAPRVRVTRQQAEANPAEVQTRAADALAYRMAGGTLPEASREFVNMSLRDMAADALNRTGVTTRGMNTDEMFARALGTSDFPLLVSNAMGRVAMASYQAAESPLKALARQRTLPNFKDSVALRLGEMGRLEEMSEHGEFTHTSRAESGEILSLKTFGRAINVSRKLLIDDDLNLLGDMTSAMGQAAAQTEAEELVKVLTGNPTMRDGKKVFHADRENYATTGSALSEASLNIARKAMRVTKGLDGKTIIDAQPKYLVVGPEMELAAEKLLAAIQPNTTADVNPFAGKLTLVVEPRITGNGFYLLADQARVPSLQYAYLASAQGVQIQRTEAWDTLGLKYRAFLDFGAGWLDWRGAYSATGAA